MKKLICLGFALSAPSAFAAGATNRGFTLSLGIAPTIGDVAGDVTETTTETTTVTSSGASTVDEDEDGTVASVSDRKVAAVVGLGYTFGFGLHLGMRYQQTKLTNVTTVETGTGDGALKFEVTTKETLAAFGPTLGFVGASGWFLFATPYLSVATGSESTSKVWVAGVEQDDSDPEVTSSRDDSKHSGYLVELGWQFRLGAFGLGPQLNYELIETKMDTSVTTRDERVFTTETETRSAKGSVKNATLYPMIGMSLCF